MDQFPSIDIGRPPDEPGPPPACIAHDLANLLTILNGSLELATRHAVGNAVVSRHLTNMHVVAARATALIEDLRLSLKAA